MKHLTLRFTVLAGLALVLAGTASAAPTLDERRAELAQISKDLEFWQGRTGPRINTAIEHVPDYVRAHLDTQNVPLRASERKALLEQGLGALPPEKRAVFEGAAPAAKTMKLRLQRYFEAYDKFMGEEVKLRTFGAVLRVLERHEALKPLLKEKQAAKLDPEVAKVVAFEAKYREALADPNSKNHDISNSSDRAWWAADEVDDLLTKFERKHGLQPKLHWGKRVGGFFRSVKRKARVARIYASCLPAVGRMFSYLYNPFRKKADPGKVASLLRFFSKSYRWAAGMKLEVVGAENIPSDAPVVFAFSHRSTIEDAVSMMAVVPDEYSFMVAQRAIPAFLNGKLVNEPSIINVGGKKDDGTTVDAVRAGIESLEESLNLAIFPEGDVPTPTGETHALRSGIDVITQAVSDQPVYIVPVTIDDPNAGVDSGVKNLSKKQKIQVTVTFGQAIDPLKLKSIPGADRQLLLDVIRAHWHRNLYRPDVQLKPADASEQDLGEVPDARQGAFEALHQGQ
jgi:1-acyl-sn-glycerol-3-phosphate acyltransferase